jgi:hypothetical protein
MVWLRNTFLVAGFLLLQCSFLQGTVISAQSVGALDAAVEVFFDVQPFSETRVQSASCTDEGSQPPLRYFRRNISFSARRSFSSAFQVEKHKLGFPVHTDLPPSLFPWYEIAGSVAADCPLAFYPALHPCRSALHRRYLF